MASQQDILTIDLFFILCWNVSRNAKKEWWHAFFEELLAYGACRDTRAFAPPERLLFRKIWSARVALATSAIRAL